MRWCSITRQLNIYSMEQNSKVTVTFAALDPYIEVNEILPTETRIAGKDMVQWGTRNNILSSCIHCTQGFQRSVP